MEIFQQIWHALTTPNKLLIDILSVPLSFIEITVTMLLFTSILNISSTKKQKIFYIFSLSIIAIISSAFIPKTYGNLLHMIICPLLIMYFFKTTLLKALSAEIILFIIAAFFDTLIIKFYLIFFNISYNDILIIPFFRLVCVCTAYITYFILFILSKHFKFNINLLDNIDNKNKRILILNCILGIIAIGTQFFLADFYSNKLPIIIVFLSIISLLTYFFISIYNLIKITQLLITTQYLEESKLYNKTLSILHDNIRGFKHDFSNIVQAIGRLY